MNEKTCHVITNVTIKAKTTTDLCNHNVNNMMFETFELAITPIKAGKTEEARLDAV